MTTITVAKIELKEKRSIVVTTEGRRLGVWTTNLGKFDLKTGGTYEVETEENDFNGRMLTNITKAKQIGSMPAATTPHTPANGGGTSHYRPTCPQDAERMFVCAAFTAFIKAGKIEPELGKVTNAIGVLRQAYQKTFGSDDRIFPASESGRHAA